MDDSQPGRGDLTAQRDVAAAKLWAFPVRSKEWDCVVSCTLEVRRANPGKWDNLMLSSVLTYPHRHPEFLDAILAEYAARKLLGETP